VVLLEVWRTPNAMSLVVIAWSHDNDRGATPSTGESPSDREFARAVRARGLTRAERAKRAGLSQATASATFHGELSTSAPPFP
jgi:hypothetical protein